MTAPSSWRPTETLAWVEHDSPSPPPVSRAARLTVAAALASVMVAMLATDTLCPEHRAWIIAIGTASFVAAGAAVVALVRGSWIATPLTLTSACGGVACGLFDATHDLTRGTVVAIAFAVIAGGAAALMISDLARLRWDAALQPAAWPADVVPVAVEVGAGPAHTSQRADAASNVAALADID